MLAFYMSLIDDDSDKNKFEIIYYKYRKQMLSMAYSVLKNQYDAEEAVQETFIKIARNIKSIKEPQSPSTLSYVLKATKNNSLNKLKSNKKRYKFYDEFRSEKIADIPDNTFIEQLDIKNNYEKTVEVIKNMDEIYRDVLFFYFVEEMSASEIADLLDRKKSTVKQQIARGKKIIIKKMQGV